MGEMPKNVIETPLMKQYYDIKRKHPDAILLFRVGDFYETFDSDAVIASGILGITLTKRANGAASYVDLAGFPYHALDTYLPKLVRAGQRVAICDQLEDPKLTKKIVKRGITELVTPGVSLNDSILDHKENNFLACVHFENKYAGIAFLDISTGEFYVTEGPFEYIDKLLNNFNPKETLVERSRQELFTQLFGSKLYTYKLDDWVFNYQSANDKLLKQFQTSSLKGFGIDVFQSGIIAAGAVLQYLDITQHQNIKHITKIARIEEESYVWLDRFTVRNLELFELIQRGGKTFAEVVDMTISPMGSRLLKKWIAMPLKNVSQINERLSVVENIISDEPFRDLLHEQIYRIGDIERIASKISVGKVLPRELLQLETALGSISEIKEACSLSAEQSIKKIGEQLQVCDTVKDKIRREIQQKVTNQINKGNIISEGVSPELDELRKIAYSGKDYILQIQQRETEKTGINSLKIGFNNVFGYYIEVRNTHKDKVPAEWIRKQTLVSAERYITPELKEYEEKVLGAEEKILVLETSLYNELVIFLSDYINIFQSNASLVARLDCLYSFARIAIDYDYCKPDINDTEIIDIKHGRHPVIERQLPIGEPYITNDVYLDCSDQQIMIITGPNMSGKSAFLRQTALIVLMAQMGSYVPARSASIGYIDKLYTRVGASDNISLGESTFMVEMIETASILNNISRRSLVILDEIGRGTSTYDGISIAWAIAEYIHEHPEANAKTVFATHYHELNEMENSFARIKNYNVSVKEHDNKVIFLRKMVRGGSEHSFGIHVAEMAGLPKSVVKRAGEILLDLEKGTEKSHLSKPVNVIAQHREGMQMSIFQLDDPVLKQIRDEIKNLDVNNLTPVEALNKLNEIKKLTGI